MSYVNSFESQEDDSVANARPQAPRFRQIPAPMMVPIPAAISPPIYAVSSAPFRYFYIPYVYTTPTKHFELRLEADSLSLFAMDSILLLSSCH